MADWATISALATAGGTLVLAIATFASVRSANKAARISERRLELGLRPLLTASRLEDPPQKIMWSDEHLAKLEGGRGSVEIVDQNLYFAMSVRNAGAGIAVLHGWHPGPSWPSGQLPHAPIGDFRTHTRDMYVPAGDMAFWQAAIRGAGDSEYGPLREAIEAHRPILLDVLYGDHEGGQRTISRFALAPPAEGTQWLCSVTSHWNLDRPDPR